MPTVDENTPIRIATAYLTGEGSTPEIEITITPKEIGLAVADYDGFFSADLEKGLTFEHVADNLVKITYKKDSLYDCFARDGENSAMIFEGDYYLFSGVVIVDTEGQEIKIDSAGKSPLVSKRKTAIDGEGVTVEQVKITLPDANGEPFDFEGYMFKLANGRYVNLSDMSRGVMLALMTDYFVAYAISDEDYSTEDMPERIAEILKKITPKNRRRKPYNYSQTSTIKYPNDPVTIALMQRFTGHFEPADYFSDKGREIKTGEGGTINLQVRAAANVDITAPEETYVLDDTANFWATMLFNVARDTGANEVWGTDILKRAGLKNPGREDASSTLGEAARAITKALTTWIALDTTNERQRKGRKKREVLESFGLRPAIRGGIDFVTEAVLDEDGNQTGEIVKDFVVTLDSQNDVIEAFPVFTYAVARNMLLTFNQNEIEFKGLNLSTDARRMWFYVLKRIKSKQLSNKIKFSTMFETLALESRGKDAMRKKKERMIKQLEKMLFQASGGLRAGEKMKKDQKPQYPRRIDSWKYTTDAAGRVDGVEITPLKVE